MAQKVFIREKENEVLELPQMETLWIALTTITLLVVVFVYLYSKKKRALLLAQNRRTVSSLRLENIRNRLSPHFIFNVLNQEMAGRKAEEKQELSSLVKLMRRNLELAEQLCVTLAEELDFVKTYIDLERRSLGITFHPMIEIGEGVNRASSAAFYVDTDSCRKCGEACSEREGRRKKFVDYYCSPSQWNLYSNQG